MPEQRDGEIENSRAKNNCHLFVCAIQIICRLVTAGNGGGSNKMELDTIITSFGQSNDPLWLAQPIQIKQKQQ